MVTFSQAAARDVENILHRSLKEFGQTQTEKYYVSLKKCLELLSVNPAMGNSAIDIKTGYFRFPHRSHVIFYTHLKNDIFIMRILHKSMDIVEHL
jgi:toxin ParE1/3/4